MTDRLGGGRSLRILGGGQLGRMLMESARGLGIDAACFDPNPACSASHAGPVTEGSFDDLEAVRRFAQGADAVTCEWESVPLAALEAAAEHAPLAPGVESFRVARDRYEESSLFERLGIEAPESRRVQTLDELDGLDRREDLVLKARFGGYDGRGQVIARVGRLPDTDRTAVGGMIDGGGVLAQAFVPFERELSIVLARDASGDVRRYPIAENVHDAGILVTSIAPAPGLDQGVAQQIERAAAAIANELGHAGVLAVEFFDLGKRVVVNEIAPRVHNSGHWTLGFGGVSQFEQHVRAVLGLSLGSEPGAGSDSGYGGVGEHRGIVNVLGEVPTELIARVQTGWPGVRVDLRDYGKEPAPGRKVGHVAVASDEVSSRDGAISDLRAVLRGTGANRASSRTRRS